MTLMALLRHGEVGHHRRDVLAVMWNIAFRRGRYAGSREELLPAGWDPPAALPVVVVGAMMLGNPRWWNKIAKPTQSSVTLSPDAWELLGVS
jgi:hypothetical protein